jgi:phosphate transport system substrate-binding protein
MKKQGLMLILMSILLGCAPRSGRIDIAGSTTILPIAQAVAEAYMETNETAAISVRGGGSSVGLTSIIEKTIDIAIASRAVSEIEEQRAAEAGVTLLAFTIAHDAVTIVVHPDNPVNDLSIAQLQGIFAGDITNWNQVGGADLAIAVISRDVSSGSFEVFSEIVLDSTRVIDGAMRLPSNNAVATAVSYTPGSIGYVGMGYVHSGIKALSVNGTMPSAKAVHDASYPLARPLYMVTLASAKPEIKDFIDYLLSVAGQKIVTEQGYIALHREEL